MSKLLAGKRRKVEVRVYVHLSTKRSIDLLRYYHVSVNILHARDSFVSLVSFEFTVGRDGRFSFSLSL